MRDLTKELYFNENDSTTIKEIEQLADLLLNTDWFIQIYRSQIGKTFNLKELGWKFEFNNRRCAAGICNFRRKVISLSTHLLTQNLDNANQWEETLRHEVAHALDYCLRNKSNHDNHWKAVARAILSTGERCYTVDDLQDKKSKYTLVCPSCGKETPKHKASRKEKACGSCCRQHNGGRFSTEFKLIVIQNF